MRNSALTAVVIAALCVGAGPALAFQETPDAPPEVLSVAPDINDEPAMQLQTPGTRTMKRIAASSWVGMVCTDTSNGAPRNRQGSLKGQVADLGRRYAAASPARAKTASAIIANP